MTKKILLVDDEPEVRQFLKNALTTRGYTVMEVASGREALSKLRKEKFDLMLLDLVMPEMGGLEVLRELRPSGSHLPVIILTAYGTEVKMREAIRLGAVSFIDKAISLDELTKKIESCLSLRLEGKAEQADILVVDDDPAVTTYYKDVLEGEGYKVIVSGSGEEALGLVIRYNPRLILLDIMLPGIDGLETLRQIRKFNEGVLVFLISAYPDAISDINKYNLDVYAALNKPVAGSEIKRYISEALKTKEALR